VLDHSALVPCGGKPRKEDAIRRLGDPLSELGAVWCILRKYFGVLYRFRHVE